MQPIIGMGVCSCQCGVLSGTYVRIKIKFHAFYTAPHVDRQSIDVL